MPVTWNPADKHADIALSNGNLTATQGASSWRALRSTIGKSSGKWYWEITVSAGSAETMIDVATTDAPLTNYLGLGASGWGYYGVNGKKFHDGANPNWGNSFGSSNVIGNALDMDNGKAWWSKNGVWQGSGSPDPAAGTDPAWDDLAGTVFAGASLKDNGNAVTANFGASAFTYTEPSGFSGLEAPTTTVVAEPLTANFSLQASPLFSILAEALIATTSLLGPPLRPITAGPLVATTSLSGSPLELVSIAAEPLVGNLSLSSLFVVTYDVAAEPLIADTSFSGSFLRSLLAAPLSASFGVSASIKQFLVSTLSLVLGIEVGSSLTLINSLNLDIESQLRLLNNILTSLSGNRTFKLTIEELAQVEDELRLISHILDEDSGKTYGDFYFSKPHGIT